MKPKLASPILREIGALSRSVHSISDIRLRPLHLQKGQFPFLTRVIEEPGICFQELSHRLRVDKATATRAVQKLVQAGYLTTRPDPEDRRSICIYPTRQGEEIYPLILQEENENLEVCFTGFTPEERELTVALVRRMRENIEKKWFSAKGLPRRPKGGQKHDASGHSGRPAHHSGNCCRCKSGNAPV